MEREGLVILYVFVGGFQHAKYLLRALRSLYKEEKKHAKKATESETRT
jgi:hypothetical protein